MRNGLFGWLVLLAAWCGGCGVADREVGGGPRREFRGVWVATVGNIDWPSKAGLSADQQQSEMRAILDRCVALHLNAVILQVRTACDALYPSKLEPWSGVLSGRQGTPPEPYYDPLALWVAEAHRRGLELHAWFNPFRVSVPGATSSPAAANHVSRTRPELVKQYGEFQWLDPGEPAAREISTRVILDVVRRYDVDGVHIDDYFYPYPKKGIEFPDGPSWSRYVRAGGRLSRGDWRRANLDLFIERLYRDIKYTKPWVKFGISPFGIYRPGEPRGVRGFDQYDGLYADVKKWWNSGWCDYLSPQLYWKISSPGQPFAVLLAWWAEQNFKGRNLWPGIYTGRIVGTSTRPATTRRNSSNAWAASEIIDQIEATRRQTAASGEVHFSMKTLMADRGGIDEALEDGPYATAALVPASPWLGWSAPASPMVGVRRVGDQLKVSLVQGWFAGRPWVWGVGVKSGNAWRWEVRPVSISEWTSPEKVNGSTIDAIAVEAINRVGMASRATVVNVKDPLHN